MRAGWDVKALIKTIVTSATYRQSSSVSRELLQKDPENRLLARGPRFRLAASRSPSAQKRGVLLGSFQHYLDTYQTNPEAALKLVSAGESPRNEKLNVSESAAYTTVASLILNLDETVTKE